MGLLPTPELDPTEGYYDNAANLGFAALLLLGLVAYRLLRGLW
jgi:hypothetical protein